MQPSIDMPRRNRDKWVYATLRVRDGDRLLKPSHVGGDRIRFTEPPHLTSSEIEIILTVGDAEQRTMAIVLPHDPNERYIPIQLVTERPGSAIAWADTAGRKGGRADLRENLDS